MQLTLILCYCHILLLKEILCEILGIFGSGSIRGFKLRERSQRRGVPHGEYKPSLHVAIALCP